MHKKTFFIIITFGYVSVFIFDYLIWGYLEFGIVFFKYLLVALFSALFVRYYSKKQTFSKKKSDLYLYLGYLLLYIFLSFVFFQIFAALSLLTKILLVILFTSFFYLLLISGNVYIVALNLDKKMPLLKPSVLFLFLGQVVIVFLFGTFVYKIQAFRSIPLLNLSIKSVLFLFFYYFLLSLEFNYIENKVGEWRNDLSYHMTRVKDVTMGLLPFMFFISLLLTFYPMEDYSRALILGSLMYFGSTLAQLYITHRQNLKFYVFAITTVFIIYFVSVSA